MGKYTIEAVTRLTESAAISYEYDWDVEEDNYEVTYIVRDENGEQVYETGSYTEAKWYMECTEIVDETEEYHEPDWENDPEYEPFMGQCFSDVDPIDWDLPF